MAKFKFIRMLLGAAAVIALLAAGVSTSLPNGARGAEGTPARSVEGASSAAPGRARAHPCETRYVYRIKSKKVINKWVPSTNFVDGPGGEIRVKVERAHTFEISLSTSVSVEVEALFLKAKAEVGAGLAKKNTVTVGHVYTKKIPKKMYGHARYRVISYKITFDKVRERWTGKKCKDEFVGGGTATIPTSKEGWKFWTTRTP